MIATVTMNPCIDKTVYLNGFTYGGTNLVASARHDTAGKGLNVSLALKSFGIDSTAISFEFTENPGAVQSLLAAAGITSILPQAAGALRTNLKIFEQDGHIMTELNERGTAPSSAALSAMRTAILRTAETAEILVLSGSLPPGVPETFYRDIMRATHRNGLRFVVDTGGNALRTALSANPYLIKPNVQELSTLLDRELLTLPDRICAAKEAVALGAELCCLSMDAEGALLVSKTETYFAPGLAVDVKSAQGAGDSMVAGFLDAHTKRLPLPDMLRHAVAAASATIMQDGTQIGTAADYQRLCREVRISQ